ncbi:hypothetical protein BDK51DRAFT_38263 [Blyttiomyces helicus]|uniref:Uncharacterized protein n=1 Tax=Blyttiomyces helicus TaxID=388810 RepID=A0A4P9W3J4_9FUNG|nr:hypothetical protein BDK51DRAFT_38263 [Blyttiomyces helicus]|eukprot:RKO86891.1 hypothetical protein BDK51DRAFT_38263 [Blyttiomyces helicus]
MDKTVDKTVDKATHALFFFTMEARKRSAPFKRFSVALEDGRLDHYLLSALNLTSIDLWSMHNRATPYPLPPGLSDSISLIAACNSMQSESARRTIISLYLSYAFHKVDPDAKFLTIAEEINIASLRKSTKTASPKLCTKRAHSDAALLVVEAKRRTMFEAVLGQVIAQAASILCYRRNAAHRRGAYRTYWAYSDGERWTDEIKGRLKLGFDKKGCKLVINHVVGLASRAFGSTPRNSLVDLSETGDSSGDEDDGGENDPDADPALIDSVVDPLSSVRL